MLETRTFIDTLLKGGVRFFAGVPDSTLQDFIRVLDSENAAWTHVIAANEGGAVGLAVGYHLATDGVPLVYLQNSGLGNAVNPLLSIAHAAVYSVPILLIVGWRGCPGQADEPQHGKQGAATPSLLTAMDIPYIELSDESAEAEYMIETALARIRSRRSPHAFLVRPGTFSSASPENSSDDSDLPTREDAIHRILSKLKADDIVVASTGMISREVLDWKNKSHPAGPCEFLNVGGMGHASQIALGIAMMKPRRRVVCLDGDGALLMHMGGLAIIGAQRCPNLIHVVLNNGCHDSVGGHPTVARRINLVEAARAVGYARAYRCTGLKALEMFPGWESSGESGHFLEIVVRKGHRKNLPRPDGPFTKRRERFMSNVVE